jgi:hypothetical protein
MSNKRPIPLAKPRITLTRSQASVAEDSRGKLLFTFTRSGSVAKALRVFYTVGGTATPGLDYTGIGTTRTTRQVIFAAGSSRAPHGGSHRRQHP